MAAYRMRCRFCGKTYENDSNFRLQCDGEKEKRHGPALLVAEFEGKQIRIRPELPGVFEYADWLPIGRYYLNLDGHLLGKPFTYKSQGLAKRLGLKSLYIAFSGHWPEKGPKLLTRAFKEFEAQVSLARYLATYRQESPLPFVVSSAGNTANGYNLISHVLGLPVYLVVPESGLDNLLLPMQTNSFVVMVKGDYSDATAMADLLASKTGLPRDGGIRNVARLAGLGTVMLNAVAHPTQGSHRMFHHYFQAVGSAAGALAAWQAAELLIADGRFGDTMPRIHLAQNAPFTPIPDAWEKGSRTLPPLDDNLSRERIASVTASVLTTRHPPYSMAGGIYDMMKTTNGMTWRVSNCEVFQSSRMFREAEGIDIGPSAAVAVGSLKQAVENGAVMPDENVLLHVTGGGREIQFSEGPVYRATPSVITNSGNIEPVLEALGPLRRIQNPSTCLASYL